jgi:hypothetical protein
MAAALGKANGVLLVDDAELSLAKALVGEPARNLASQARRLAFAGAGGAVALSGETVSVGGGVVARGLGVAPGLVPTPDWMAEGAFDRLALNALLSGGALGVGLSPDNAARVAGGALTAVGSSPVLLLETDKVSLANPNVPTARDMRIHVIAPGETYKP